jgi:hypothetical protein
VPTFKNIEDIQAWQKARQVTQMIYALTQATFTTLYDLLDEVSRMTLALAQRLRGSQL